MAAALETVLQLCKLIPNEKKTKTPKKKGNKK